MHRDIHQGACRSFCLDRTNRIDLDREVEEKAICPVLADSSCALSKSLGNRLVSSSQHCYISKSELEKGCLHLPKSQHLLAPIYAEGVTKYIKLLLGQQV